MTKADSKKLILFNVLEEYFYIVVIYLLTLNFFDNRRNCLNRTMC